MIRVSFSCSSVRARCAAHHPLHERKRSDRQPIQEILFEGASKPPHPFVVGAAARQTPGPTRKDKMMRKVTAGLFSSIDGVVQAPNEWQPAFDEEMGSALSRMLEEQDAVLLGRVTFEDWAGYWPTSTEEPFASWINSTPKYVASTTLDSVDSWANSTLITGSATDFIADLKQRTAAPSAPPAARRSFEA
jgi:hypothetical protein